MVRRDRQSRVLATEAPKLVKAALTRPMIAYLADVQPPGLGGPPSVRAGLVASLEGQANAIGQALVSLERLAFGGQTAPTKESGGVAWHDVPGPNEMPPVQWGIWNGYLIIGMGQGEAVAAQERLASQDEPPAWLVKLRREMDIERLATVGYLNVARLVEQFGPLLGDRRDVLAKLGLDNVQSISSASGLDQTACVSRLEIAIDGPPQGVFALLPHEPLSGGDLARIPHGALFAAAVRMDAAETLDQVNQLIAKFQPDAREQFEEALWQAETELGVNLRTDLLNALDDVWLLYVPKGDVLTSWVSATAVVKVKDPTKLEETLGRLTERAAAELSRAGRRGGAVIRTLKVAGRTVRFLSMAEEMMPFAPAWCLTDDALVVGLMPQTVKAFLSRDQGDNTSADSLDLSGALSGANPPSAISYFDTQSVFRGIYPLIQIGARVLCGNLQREGIDIHVGLLPSSETVAAHLTPAVSTWAKTDAGYVCESRQALPGGGDLISSMPIAVAMLLPAVQSARNAAREAQDTNQLKQLALAFHNYCDVHRGSFPANTYDAEGKPLLSWRVQLLPYLEGVALYDEFHLDEPWDSPHNKTLIPRMPSAFRSPTFSSAPGKTRFVALVGDRTLFPGNKKLSLRNVTDGTSNTLMFVRAAPSAAVVWTKPDDLKVDPQTLKRSLMSQARHILVAFCDGSVRRLPVDLPDATLAALITRDGGEVIDNKKLRAR